MPSLMVEKGIRGGIFHAMHGYANANNTYMKNHDHHKFCIQMQIIHVDGQYLRTCL